MTPYQSFDNFQLAAQGAKGIFPLKEVLNGLRTSSLTYRKETSFGMATHYAFLKPHFKPRFSRPGDGIIVDAYVSGAKPYCYDWTAEAFLNEHLAEGHSIHEYDTAASLRDVKYFECPQCHEEHPLLIKMTGKAKYLFQVIYFMICPESKRIRSLFVPEEITWPKG